MRVSIHQPAYLPWLGYFDKIAQCDLFIYLDSVQFQKNSFQNRNKIRTKEGWIWLTVPVLTKGELFRKPIGEIGINKIANWRKKHLAAIQMNYRKAPNFEREYGYLEQCLQKDWEYLSDLCYEMMCHFMKRLAIDTRVVKSSELSNLNSAKSDLILDLCREVGADEYFSGAMGSNYLDEDKFLDAGISVGYQDYKHPVYTQTYQGFEPYMGIIDQLMNYENPEVLFEKLA
jgi:hypothetical protein